MQRHTSYDMVQTSMSSQESFIETVSRQHAEMMFLNDRNHLEIVGMVNETLKVVADVMKEYINKVLNRNGN